MAKTDKETLARYVTRIIKEKELTHQEVRRLARGKITDGYVRGIMTGKATNVSVDKLKALACGLGVSEDEIFRVARGVPSENDSKAQEHESFYRLIVNLMSASLKNKTLTELLLEASRLPLESQEEAVRLLKFLNTRKSGASQSRKKA
jgi:transcriptional regulator with XRE-family HTH domain